MFLILASIEDVSSWNKELLHKILIAGDFMYNSIQKSDDLLQFSDLPRYIHYENSYFSVVQKQTYAGCMSPNVLTDIGTNLENCLNLIFVKQSGCILVFNSSAIAIYFDKRTTDTLYMIHTVGVTMVYVILKEIVLCRHLVHLASYATFCANYVCQFPQVH